MADTQDKQDTKPEAPKPESLQKVDSKPQPRELTPEELKAVAGGPYVVNN